MSGSLSQQRVSGLPQTPSEMFPGRPDLAQLLSDLRASWIREARSEFRL